jgi:hypothetical protein
MDDHPELRTALYLRGTSVCLNKEKQSIKQEKMTHRMDVLPLQSDNGEIKQPSILCYYQQVKLKTNNGMAVAKNSFNFLRARIAHEGGNSSLVPVTWQRR